MAYTFSGDGVHETRIRLGDDAAGLPAASREDSARADETGYGPAGGLPHAGPEPFCPRCPAGGPAAPPGTG
ncbi:hypothetical protein ACWD3J_25135 [Streptomyces sp. NPDC002755]|uniref:hypothetical protein n=1 Tax=Streptomyces sp. NPDC002884 TaxID=3154544 RepID=UPI0033276B0A